MNIAGLEFNINRGALEIYVSGCNGPHCKGCHNESLWDFTYGSDWEFWTDRIERIIRKGGMVEEIWVLGGEPQDQKIWKMQLMLDFLRSFDLPIIMFTRYEALLPALEDCGITHLKTGEYISDGSPYVEPVLGIALASSNQKVVQL